MTLLRRPEAHQRELAIPNHYSARATGYRWRVASIPPVSPRWLDCDQLAQIEVDDRKASAVALSARLSGRLTVLSPAERPALYEVPDFDEFQRAQAGLKAARLAGRLHGCPALAPAFPIHRYHGIGARARARCDRGQRLHQALVLGVVNVSRRRYW